MTLGTPEYIRTMKESGFNDLQSGPIPKVQIENMNQRFHYSEASFGGDFEEFQTPGLSGAGTTDDFMLLMPEIINRQIITEIEDALIGTNLVETFKISGPVEVWLKEYGFEATEVEQASEVPSAKLRHDQIYINIIKVGIRPELTYETIADGMFDLMARHVRQCGVAMAKYKDLVIFEVLNNGVPDGSTIVGTRESDHTFSAGGALHWDVIVNAYSAIQLENLNPTDMVVHPYQVAEMLKLKEYRDASGVFISTLTGRMQGAINNGTLPPLLGMRVWVSRHQPAGQVLIVDRQNFGALAQRSPILIESERNVVRQLSTVVFTERYGAGILNNDGGALITDCRTSL